MAQLGIDAFKAKLKGGGARPNLFRVICNFPASVGGDSELASFMIKSASLPASEFGEILVGFRGRKLKMAGDRTFSTWPIKVFNDTGMEIRNAFERWQHLINAHEANTGMSAPADYQVDMAVEQLNKAGNVIKTYNFRGAFPKITSAIELDWDTNDSIEEFSVDLEYQYWESDTTPRPQ